MTYKARRTRDLQGEVQAGTGISVTESVKPDGTKVYTLENTAPGGGNEFEEIKIIDSDNNVKMLLDTDGVHIYNDNENEVAVLTKEDFVLRDDENGTDKVYINRDGTISCYNSEGNETLYIDYENGDISIRNNSGNDKCIITSNYNLADLQLCDEDGNVVLSGIGLIDMQNSLWSFAPGIKWLDEDNPFLSFGLKSNIIENFCLPNNVRENDYYTIEDADYTNIEGLSANGILVRYAGVYQLTINAFLCSDATNQDIFQRIDIVRNNAIIESRLTHLDLGRLSAVQDYGGHKTTTYVFNIDTDNTYIVPFWYRGNGYTVGFNDNVAYGEYTTITIQKIR